MERKFYADNFEKFLKGQADSFRMTPSKKVWHGIYNDVHPGKRWPSIAMSMMFIFTLVIIGHLNTNNPRTPLSHLPFFFNTNIKLSQALNSSKKTSVPKSSYNKNIYVNKTAENVSFPIAEATAPPVETNNTQKSLQLSTSDKEITNSTVSDEGNNKVINTFFDPKENEQSALNNTHVVYKNTNSTEENASSLNANIVADQNNTAPPTAIKINKKNSAVWSYYASPSLSYRNFYGNSTQLNNSVNQKPMIGLEVGTSMSFKISKQLQGVSGLQLNYSGYNIKANHSHPVLATLMLNTSTPGVMEPQTSVASFSNGAAFNKATIKNFSVYASIPIGVQYSFGIGDNVKLNASATLQPTFLVAGNAYLLSTDKKNYLNENTLLRKWNMGTNFGTSVSFKASSYNWQIGPQINYQILSSYFNKSPYNEHLINYGIRFGVSKSK